MKMLELTVKLLVPSYKEGDEIYSAINAGIKSWEGDIVSTCADPAISGNRTFIDSNGSRCSCSLTIHNQS